MTPLLGLRDVVYHYPAGAANALDGISLTFTRGQRVVLLGRNGSGKSTLLLHCNGILRPQQGSVWLDGRPVTYDRRGLLGLRQQVGLVLQRPDEQLFSASVRQDISFGPLNLGLTEAAARQRVAEAAALCEISDLLDRPTHALSGGEKTRVALAGVLAMQPALLLADELTNSLDPWMRRQALTILDRLVAGGATVVLATHDLVIARAWAERVIVLAEGRVRHDGPTTQVFSDPIALNDIGADV